MTSINGLGTRSLSLKSVSELLPTEAVVVVVVAVSERGREQTEVAPDLSDDDSPPPPPPPQPPGEVTGVGGLINPVESCFED